MASFHEMVWQKCREIPKGKVTTYKELGNAINSRAYRAIGTALSKNPHAPEVPCHRVVKSKGSVGGYSGKGGKNAKIKLLEKEGVSIKDGIVDLEKFLHRFRYSK
ncbi:MGMT family protein [Candidatus Woesearchaeota archaeon]|nr:MGMT family protein [Candidatus Woesearchaeota archaeon]